MHASDQPSAQSSGQKKRAFSFIVITLVLDAMGFGLVIPVMPDLIKGIQGGTLGDAAVWAGIMTTVFAVMQFLFGPTIGSLSDRFGRRPVLLMSLFVMSLDYLVLALAQNLWLLLVIRMIGGITAATHSTASAYVADISDPDDKAANFGILGAAFGVGFVLGPVIGGLLAEFGVRAPFYAAAALAFANMVFGYFVLPETVTDRIRRPFEWRRANPVGAFRKIVELPQIRVLLALFFIYEFALMVYSVTWAFFTQERLGWDSRMVGWSLGAYGISIAVVQAVLLRYVLRWLGNRLTIIWGIVFELTAMVFLVFVTQGWMVMAFIPIMGLGAVVHPALTGVMSRMTDDNQQGELQGVLSSIRSVAHIFAPMVMGYIFWFYTRETGLYLPGAPFAFAAILTLIGLVIFVGFTQRDRPRPTSNRR
ncbi:TCR/Tet family MFS transporter [Aestuariibius sp. HNIBRBA575]|uniref:TCR/Tet family MFS transporter n=1 Tax=Aestuariibius sp. HNIBRBA575 TaxID=3233343 RepID=UPI0034A55B8D